MPAQPFSFFCHLIMICSRVPSSWMWSSRPDTVVEESEEVPLSRSLGLEVPEDPSACVLLERTDLSLNVALCRVFHGLIPLIDEVLGCAGADVGGGVIGISGLFRVCAVITSTDTITVLAKRLAKSKRNIEKTYQSWSAVSHGSSPFTTDQRSVRLSPRRSSRVGCADMV